MLTHQQAIEKLKLVAKKLKKPLMVDVGTQTELTMIDLAEMENNIPSHISTKTVAS